VKDGVDFLVFSFDVVDVLVIHEERDFGDILRGFGRAT
jgi:hypothetical protein